jgi:hypothetical protein
MVENMSPSIRRGDKNKKARTQQKSSKNVAIELKSHTATPPVSPRTILEIQRFTLPWPTIPTVLTTMRFVSLAT